MSFNFLQNFVFFGLGLDLIFREWSPSRFLFEVTYFLFSDLVCYFSDPLLLDDPKITQLMSIWGEDALHRWPVGVVWFATFLLFLGTSYGTKATYRSSINAFNTIYEILDITSPFRRLKTYPSTQVDVFMALATMASYKAASTCRVAKSAAEDAWLLSGNRGPVIDAVLWKRMFNGIKVYKGTTLAEKVAIVPSQVRGKIE